MQSSDLMCTQKLPIYMAGPICNLIEFCDNNLAASFDRVVLDCTQSKLLLHSGEVVFTQARPPVNIFMSPLPQLIHCCN